MCYSLFCQGVLLSVGIQEGWECVKAAYFEHLFQPAETAPLPQEDYPERQAEIRRAQPRRIRTLLMNHSFLHPINQQYFSFPQHPTLTFIDFRKVVINRKEIVHVLHTCFEHQLLFKSYEKVVPDNPIHMASRYHVHVLWLFIGAVLPSALYVRLMELTWNSVTQT